MLIHDYPLDWYIKKIQNKEYFSIGMYGDGEWQSIFNHYGSNFGGNCEKTLYTRELTKRMIQSLKFKELGFYFATDDFSKSGMPYYNTKADLILEENRLDIEFVDKGIWNKEMCGGGLYPFIKELRNHNVCIVSNKMLRGLTFLNYDKFVEVGYPNCFQDIERATKECLDYGKSGIYIFACGIPATLFVQELHGKIPNSWFLDLGSVWDGFVGIGGQRPTRREFYLHPETWKEWVSQNLQEIEWETKELPVVEWYGMGSKEINKNL